MEKVDVYIQCKATITKYLIVDGLKMNIYFTERTVFDRYRFRLELLLFVFMPYHYFLYFLLLYLIVLFFATLSDEGESKEIKSA
jgi:hypothetical protein